MADPKLIDHFEILEPLGEGGMGKVYLAHDKRLNRRVAIKVVSLDEAVTEQERKEREMFTANLLREAEIAASLDHPGIVTIYQVGLYANKPYIVMQFIDGPTLEKLLAAGTPLDHGDTKRILKDVAVALDYAHQMGVIHRDIKPANIMLPRGRAVKVCDFGIAKSVMLSSKKSSVVMGTPHYMSPEHLSYQSVSERTDQWALGVVAYRMLTGRLPFQTADQIVHGPLPSLREIDPMLAPRVMRVLEKALSKDPAGRYPTCSDFAAHLAAALEAPVDSAIMGVPDLQRAEIPQHQRERAETMRLAAERAGREQRVHEEAEKARLAAEGAERESQERERAEAARLAQLCGRDPFPSTGVVLPAQIPHRQRPPHRPSPKIPAPVPPPVPGPVVGSRRRRVPWRWAAAALFLASLTGVWQYAKQAKRKTADTMRVAANPSSAPAAEGTGRPIVDAGNLAQPAKVAGPGRSAPQPTSLTSGSMSSPPLTLSQVSELISAGTQEQVLLRLIKNRQLAFVPGTNVLDGLRKKGASVGTLAALRQQTQLRVAPAAVVLPHSSEATEYYDIPALGPSCHVMEVFPKVDIPQGLYVNSAVALVTSNHAETLQPVYNKGYIGAHPIHMDSVTFLEAGDWLLISFRIGNISGGAYYSSLVRKVDLKVLWNQQTDIGWDSTINIRGDSLLANRSGRITALDLRTGKATR